MSARAAQIRVLEGGDAAGLNASEIAAAVARVGTAGKVSAERMADVLAHAFELWRHADYARRRVAIGEIARAPGYSLAMMENSIDALLKPFTREALMSMAAQISSNRKSDRPRTVGFIVAGNVAGAGIHEIAIALIAGAGVVIKTASSEPVFFAEFARTIAEIDPGAGAHIEVLHWDRTRVQPTSALIARCGLVVAYGDDNTMRSLRRSNVIEFGSRVSAAVVARGAMSAPQVERGATSLARDVALFEQLGCLSPHQVFVVGIDSTAARDFAISMAAALERIGESMPPAQIPIRDAAEIRGARERARWRAIAGEPVELFEGRRLEWTVVFEGRPDRSELFKISPGFRTVNVTAVRDIAELRKCLASVSGRLEAIAIAGDEAGQLRSTIAAMQIPYICAPGEMQSPPLDWRHGGGAFLDAMVGAR